MPMKTKSILPTNTDKIDFNGDGYTDLVWKGADGTLVVWNKDVSGIYGVDSTIFWNPDPWHNSLTLRGVADFNGRGTTDMLWQSDTGRVQLWTMSNNGVTGVSDLGVRHKIEAVGDFNGDGKADMLYYSPPAAGQGNGVWVAASTEAGRKIPPTGTGALDPISADFGLVGVGDFNGDGRDDILFRGTGNATVGTFLIQEMTGQTSATGGAGSKTVTFRDPGPDWAILTLGDMNGDRKTDFVWQHTNHQGEVDARTVWLAGGGGGLIYNPGVDWEIRGSGDYNNDGRTDLLAYHKSGWYVEYLMNGADVIGFGASIPTSGDFWTLGSV